MTTTPPRPLFALGRTVATPSALAELCNAGMTPAALLDRHHVGDWGDLSADDRRANDHALRDGERILSAYVLPTGAKVWIITEWDRSVTTILLPTDY